MSNIGKFRDPYPKILPAGKQTTLEEQNSDKCIRQDVFFQAPSTPEHIKKFRKSFNNRPGMKQIHPGMQDIYHDPNTAFGKKTYGSQHVDTVIKPQNLQGLAEFHNQIRQKVYASGKNEPLGRSIQRGHVLPQECNKSQFAFGVPSKSQISTKELLYPKGGHFEENRKNQVMYKMTHGNYDAGEQRSRGYDWGNIDKDAQKFGKTQKKLLNGAAQAAHQERFEGDFPKTVIVQKTVEDQKAVAHEHLGQSKNLGTGAHLDDGRTFGMPSVKVGSLSWNAAKCIHGEPTQKQLRQDSDLGKCTRTGCQNIVRNEGDIDRVFGCPSIRTDIPFKQKKSIADPNNYGDEPQANQILYPRGFWQIGVSEEDFMLLRTKEELKNLFDKIGFQYKVGKFNAMFNKACQIVRGMHFDIFKQSGHQDHSSIYGFMNAMQMYHHME